MNSDFNGSLIEIATFLPQQIQYVEIGVSSNISAFARRSN